MSIKERLSVAKQNPKYAFQRLNSLAHEYYLDLLDAVRTSNSHGNVTTGSEFLVLGLRRCGNHGIINWIEKQCHGTGFFLNNLRLGENPYRYLYEMVTEEVLSRDAFFVDELRQQPYFQGEEGLKRLKKEAEQNFAWKDYLIHSYEDHTVKKVARHLTPVRRNRFFGHSNNRRDILILRDPFNLMASRFHSGRFDVQGWGDKSILAVWLDHAKEYIGETNHLHNKVLINFNQWSSNKDYRRQLADKLGLTFTDEGIDSVPEFGGGSSFEGRNFNGNAQSMDVSTRWKRFADNPEFKTPFQQHPQVFDYANRIFGEIDGVDRLRG